MATFAPVAQSSPVQADRTPDRAAHILFLTRDPVVLAASGSTTYILGLLTLLRAQGAAVTVVSTLAASRSPRLFFRAKVALPEGVRLNAPGYLRLGQWYWRPWQPRAWARLVARAAVRWPVLARFARGFGQIYGEKLYSGAWDLTAPTREECTVAVVAAKRLAPTTVIANYCFWGPLLGSGPFDECRTAILMHDLLSARVDRFRQSGTPLDMPLVTAAQEFRWLSGADTVLAAQAREAATIAPKVRGRVLVTPIVLEPRSSPETKVVPRRCLLVGSNIAPNQAGLAFLMDAVWPRVRAAVPGATLAIAGTVSRSLKQSAEELAKSGVVPLGVVQDLEAEYARAAVCLVPLLFGTGIKIKLLEALRFGKAVVTTSVGIEGVEAITATAVHVADGAEAFAEAIALLLKGNSQRNELERASLAVVERHFSPRRPLDREFVAALL